MVLIGESTGTLHADKRRFGLKKDEVSDKTRHFIG